ncbi:MAG: 50S ribosomal protein L11 methyltransferase [Anaerolineales bacterium]|nr:50S ribosomal protein L11 methyltransferase [Anaerolineales bacterium]
MTNEWLEVSLTVDGELAEAVAEVLARFAPEGVVIESTRIDPGGSPEGTVVGPLRVAAFLPVNEQIEEMRQKLEENLWYLGRIQPLPAAHYQQIAQTDWSQSWKEHYQPIAVGQRLVIVPAWMENPLPERIPIRIDPGMAFGTGTHPTTQLCLEMIEEIVRYIPPNPPSRGGKGGDSSSFSLSVSGREGGWGDERGPLNIIDIGCGSGILSIAALKLGAVHALGVDIDEQAITAAWGNALGNEIEDGLELGVGSVVEIRQGKFSLKTAPLVVANILAPVIVQLFEVGLRELMEPDGKLILSGILAEQTDQVLAAGEKHGLSLASKKQLGDWVCLMLELCSVNIC